jgi:hypothetical protein
MRTRLLIGVILQISLAGCVLPYHFTLRPGVSGTVVDGESLAPIPNANVAIATRDFRDREFLPVIFGITAPDGGFDMPSKRQWGIYIMPMDFAGPRSEATIEAVGYNKAVIQLSGSPVVPKSIKLGTVRLTRAP